MKGILVRGGEPSGRAVWVTGSVQEVQETLRGLNYRTLYTGTDAMGDKTGWSTSPGLFGLRFGLRRNAQTLRDVRVRTAPKDWGPAPT